MSNEITNKATVKNVKKLSEAVVASNRKEVCEAVVTSNRKEACEAVLTRNRKEACEAVVERKREKSITSKKIKRSIMIGVGLILVILVLLHVEIKKNFNLEETATMLNNANPVWFFVGILAVSVFILGEAFNTKRGLNISGVQTSLKDTALYAIAGFFFSAITPSASGGQPAQLVYMSKKGIGASQGTFSLMLDVICFQVVSMLLGIFGMLLYFFVMGGSWEGNWSIIFVVGFLISVVWLIILSCLLFSKKATKCISGFLIRVLCFKKRKIGINSGIENAKSNSLNNDLKNRILRGVSEYRLSSKKLIKHRDVFVKMLGTAFVQLICYNSISFCALRALGYVGLPYLNALAIQSMLFFSVAALPLPGSSGVTEGGMMVFYSGLVSDEIMLSAVFLSRIISFLLPVILTGGFLLINRTFYPSHRRLFF